MNLKSSKYPILKAFAPVYEKRVFLNTMIQTQQNCMDKLKVVEEFLRNIVSESDFSMCVPADVFDQIVESDYIKNSIETGQRGSTMGGPEVRIKALKNIYGVDLDGVAPEEFPKYGILTGKNKLSDLARDPDIFWHYGAIMLNFKKENLMDRTTLTVGSSLDFNESLMKTPTPVDDPKSVCIKGYPTQPVPQGTRFFRGLDFMHHLIMDEQLSTKNPNMLAIKADDMPGFENFELQFHGRLQFSRDAKSITVFTLKGDEMDIVNRHAERLKQLGIEVSELFG